jgi:hypothetical protein
MNNNNFSNKDFFIGNSSISSNVNVINDNSTTRAKNASSPMNVNNSKIISIDPHYSLVKTIEPKTIEPNNVDDYNPSKQIMEAKAFITQEQQGGKEMDDDMFDDLELEDDETEVDMNNFREFIAVGDLVECIMNKKHGESAMGYITYLSDVKLEISASVSSVLNKKINSGNEPTISKETGDKKNAQTAIYEFNIKKGGKNESDKIIGVDKLIMKDKHTGKGYLDFQGIEINSKVQIHSKNKKYKHKIGFVKNVRDDNNITIELTNKEVVNVNAKDGLSVNDDIYEIEALYEITAKNTDKKDDVQANKNNDIENNDNIDIMDLDFIDEIEFTKNDTLNIIENVDILEKDYICSKLEGNEILTNELMKNMEWKTNKYEKQEMVKELVQHIQILIDETDNININDNNQTIKDIINNDFSNMNSIPIVSSKYGRDIDYIGEGDMNLDVVEINNNKGYKPQNGFKTTIKQDMNMLYKNFDNDNLTLNRYIGVIDRPDVFYVDEDDDEFNKLDSKSTYHPDYWKSNGMTQKIELYGGDEVNIVGMCVVPKTFVNFSMAKNKIPLNSLNKYVDNSSYKLLSKNQIKASEIMLKDNVKIDINHDTYNKQMTKIYFNTNKDIYEEDYVNILQQLYPSPVNLLTTSQKKNISSIDDINELLSFYHFDINGGLSKDTTEIRELLTKNVEKQFTKIDKNIYKIQYNNLKEKKVEEASTQLNSLLKDELFTSEQFIEIYGEYPYLNTKMDSTLTRYNWLSKQKENGYWFFMNTINESNVNENDLIGSYNLKEKKIISDKIDFHKQEAEFLEEKLNDLVNNSDCLDLHIAKIYLSIDELTSDNNKSIIDDDDEPIKLGVIALLIEKENYRLFKRTNFNNVPMWIETENILENLLSISFGKKINADAEKYYKQIKEKCEKNMCNRQKKCIYDVVISKEKERSVCMSKEAYLVKYQIIENKVAQNFYEKLLIDIDNKSKSISKLTIENKNAVFQNVSEKERQLLSAKENEHMNVKKGKSSKLKKQFEKLIQMSMINDKNQMIYEFISTRLRQANPDEDINWFYNPDSDEKIAAKDWITEVLITIEPEKSQYYSKKLIAEYAVMLDGFYVSIIDGRRLMPMKDDDFMGYGDDDGDNNNAHRDWAVEDNREEKATIDKKLDSLEKKGEKYNLKQIITLLTTTIISDKNLLNKDALFVYEHVYDVVNEYNYIAHKHATMLFVKYNNGKKLNSNNINDREKVDRFRRNIITPYIIRKITSLLVILFQTTTNKYNIRLNHNKCNYSLEGKPYDELNYESNNIIKFFACVLKSMAKSMNTFKILDNKSEEQLFNFLVEDYKEWYKNGQIKLMYSELEAREKKWNDVMSIEKVWVQFKPNPIFYKNKNNSENKSILLLKSIDDIINKTKSEEKSMYEYSNNCCLNKIDDVYISYFVNGNDNDTVKTKTSDDGGHEYKNFNKLYSELFVNKGNMNNNENNNLSKSKNDLKMKNKKGEKNEKNEKKSANDIIEINSSIEMKRMKLDHFNVFGDNINSSDKVQEIYPNKINEKVNTALFLKYDTKGNKRLIDYNLSKCLVSGEKSELFSLKYQDTTKPISIHDKTEILKKEGNKYTDGETQKIMRNINSQNRININFKSISEKMTCNILKKISSNKMFDNDASLSKFTNELEKMYTEWDNLNNINKEKAKEDVSSALIHNSSKSIQRIQSHIINKSLSRCDANDITLAQIYKLDDNADNIYKKSKKNAYKKYFEKMIINLSKFINYKPYKKMIVPWTISHEQSTELTKSINENNAINSLFGNYQKYSENTIACVKEALDSFVSVSKLLNSMSFDNDQHDNVSNKTVNISKFTHNDHFFVCKYVYYTALNYLFRTTAIEQYNMLACELFAVFFNQIDKIDNEFNVSKEDIERENLEVREDEKQKQIRRIREMTEEEKDIDKQLKAHKLDFYSKNGKEDWERGLAVTSRDDDVDNRIIVSETKIDKSSDYNDIMMANYDDENN